MKKGNMKIGLAVSILTALVTTSLAQASDDVMTISKTSDGATMIEIINPTDCMVGCSAVSDIQATLQLDNNATKKNGIDTASFQDKSIITLFNNAASKIALTIDNAKSSYSVSQVSNTPNFYTNLHLQGDIAVQLNNVLMQAFVDPNTVKNADPRWAKAAEDAITATGALSNGFGNGVYGTYIACSIATTDKPATCDLILSFNTH